MQLPVAPIGETREGHSEHSPPSTGLYHPAPHEEQPVAPHELDVPAVQLWQTLAARIQPPYQTKLVTKDDTNVLTLRPFL